MEAIIVLTFIVLIFFYNYFSGFQCLSIIILLFPLLLFFQQVMQEPTEKEISLMSLQLTEIATFLIV